MRVNRWISLLSLCILSLGSYFGPLSSSVHAFGSNDAFQFSFTALDGSPLPLSRYRGKAVLVVNTAHYCGFTGQHEALQQLWQHYRNRGLMVVVVPSGDFSQQPPAQDRKIRNLCANTFQIDFPVTSIETISGDKAHPFYKWIAMHLGSSATPKDNLYKYLISPEGRVVRWFLPTVTPASSYFINTIEAHLPPVYTLSHNE